MSQSSTLYVGMDVQKESSAIASVAQDRVKSYTYCISRRHCFGGKQLRAV
jgi:hypothetical protein